MKIAKVSSLFLFATIFLLHFGPDTVTAAFFKLESSEIKYQLSPNLEILEDENNDLTIGDISSGLYDDDFLKYNGNTPSFGYTSSSYWTKFTIKNVTDMNNWLMQISYPPLDIIRLYTPTENGEYIVSETGDLHPFSSREIPHRDFVFRLDLPKNTEQTYYLEISTAGSAQLPISLSSGEAFQSTAILEYLLLGLYYGMGMIMVIYNLFLFFPCVYQATFGIHCL